MANKDRLDPASMLHFFQIINKPACCHSQGPGQVPCPGSEESFSHSQNPEHHQILLGIFLHMSIGYRGHSCFEDILNQILVFVELFTETFTAWHGLMNFSEMKQVV